MIKNPSANAGDEGSVPELRIFPWRRKWQPTPVFLPRKSHGQRSLAGYSPWGYKRVRYNLATKQEHQHGDDLAGGTHSKTLVTEGRNKEQQGRKQNGAWGGGRPDMCTGPRGQNDGGLRQSSSCEDGEEGTDRSYFWSSVFKVPTGTVPEKPAGEKALKIRLEVCRASQNGY